MAFEPHRAGVPEHRLALWTRPCAPRTAAPSWLSSSAFLKYATPADQLDAAQILSVLPEQVEGVEARRRLAGAAEELVEVRKFARYRPAGNRRAQSVGQVTGAVAGNCAQLVELGASQCEAQDHFPPGSRGLCLQFPRRARHPQCGYEEVAQWCRRVGGCLSTTALGPR